MSGDSPRTSGAVPSLSVVIPTFNAAAWLEPTVRHVQCALKNSPWADSEIVVVNDGSTDDTRAVLDGLAHDHTNIRSLHTTNKGRFLARLAGVKASSADLVLLVDSRVFLDEESLDYVSRALEADRSKLTWNGHVVIDTETNPYAGFWSAITFVAWREYLADPRPVSFGIEKFDHFPKGTGCFIAPRALVLEAYEHFSTLYDDLKFVSDDTHLLRHIASRSSINIAPGFSCTYHARDDLASFLGHAFGRGTRFVDGFLRPGTRYFPALVAFLAGSAMLPALAVKHPRRLGAVAGLACIPGLPLVYAGLRAAGVRSGDARSFCVLLPGFGAVYGAGIWRGVALVLRRRLGAAAAKSIVRTPRSALDDRH